MAVVNFRVDDDVRDRLVELADSEGTTLSDYVRSLILATVAPVKRDYDPHGDMPAPESLSTFNRQVLALLHRILGRLVEDGSSDVEGDREYQLQRARVLEQGFTYEYWVEVAGFRPELTRNESELIVDILQMFRIITFSISHLSGKGVSVPAELERRLAYQGLDHNDSLEGHMAAYVKFMIEDDKWEELKPQIDEADGGNSHSRKLGVYTRMLTEFRKLMKDRERSYDPDEYLLSIEDLFRLQDAQTHPSNRNRPGGN